MYDAIFIVDGIYHIFTRSIAEFKIFNSEKDFLRMQMLIDYYRFSKPGVKFSLMLERIKEENCVRWKKDCSIKERLIDILAYCIMPTHIHLILKQLKTKGISTYMNNILNSYTKYFNTKHKRKGPLWEGRFKRVAVTADEQLLHLTRYIHLNPVTAYIVNKPEEWTWSSYLEYISPGQNSQRMCHYKGLIDIKPELYKRFTEENIDHQRELAKIKNLIMD